MSGANCAKIALSRYFGCPHPTKRPLPTGVFVFKVPSAAWGQIGVRARSVRFWPWLSLPSRRARLVSR